MAWRHIDQAVAKAAIVAGIRAGLALTKASVAAGVHIATVCRWKANDPQFNRSLRAAQAERRTERYAPFIARRLAEEAAKRSRNAERERARISRVPVHSLCPACGSRAQTLRAFHWITFWRCSCWPLCRWASWRPRHPNDCLSCGGPRFWSCSRLSVSCSRCRTRSWVDWSARVCE